MSTMMTEENVKHQKKRNHLKAIIIAVGGLSVFTVHVIMAKGSTEFLVKLMHGDFISVANLFMTSFVLMGWFFVYKYLGKLL